MPYHAHKEILAMQHRRSKVDRHLISEGTAGFLKNTCCLYGFHNTAATVHNAVSGKTVFCCHGALDISPEEPVRPECGATMRVKTSTAAVSCHERPGDRQHIRPSAALQKTVRPAFYLDFQAS